MRGLRLSGTDDSPSSEQSTMTKIPSSSHWHGVGQAGVAGPCLSWTSPEPQAPGADPQTPAATQRSTSTDVMSVRPSVHLQARSSVSSLSRCSSLTAFCFCAAFPNGDFVPVTSSVSSSFCSSCLDYRQGFTSSFLCVSPLVLPSSVSPCVYISCSLRVSPLPIVEGPHEL